MTAMSKRDIRIYWHRDLPPLDVEPMGEHVVEATSHRVPGGLAHRAEQWSTCYENLMAQARHRLAVEVDRLGGSCAHVCRESIEERHDDAVDEAWLYGRFDYVLFGLPKTS